MKGAHITHRDHVINLGYSQPVEDVGHESLEPHVLDPGYEFSGLEVFIGGVSSSLPQVVYQVPIKRGEITIRKKAGRRESKTR